MAYKEVTTVGELEWARVFEGNRDMEGFDGEYADTDGAYTLNQKLSREEYDKLKQAGSQKKPQQKRMLDGELVVKFVRKHRVTNKNGEEIRKAGGAPKVLTADGHPWDFEKDGAIGNGSIGEVTNLISTFKGQDGKIYSRTSLVKVKVLEHVEYTADNNADADVGF